MEGAFDDLPGFIQSENIFIYLLCARFYGRLCEGYTFIYDINIYICSYSSGVCPGTKMCTLLSVTEVLWQVLLCEELVHSLELKG